MSRTIQTILNTESFKLEPKIKINSDRGKKTLSTRNELLTIICSNVYRDLTKHKSTKHTKHITIMAQFYPYTNLKLTLRQQRNKLSIRVSDILSDAPEEVLEGLAHVFILAFDLQLL